MPEVLSQKQIDELLGSLQSGSVDIEEMEEQSSVKVKDYDFRSPKKFTREQLKLLDNIFDNFTRLFSLQLSSMLRVGCQMNTLQVEEEEYREFNNALNDSVMVGIIGLNCQEYQIDGSQILMEIGKPVSFTIMDRLMGGDGSDFNITRDYTDIEVSLMEYLFHQIVIQMKNAWLNYAEIEHTLDMIETNSRLIQFIAPDETVVIIVVDVDIAGVKGTINICLPSSALEGLFKLFNSKFTQLAKKGDAEHLMKNKDNLMESLRDTTLAMTGILGRTEINLEDLLQLEVGDVIPLDNTVKENGVEIQVEDVPWFRGSMGVKKKKYAVKVNSVEK